jgi:hypothetical protein
MKLFEDSNLKEKKCELNEFGVYLSSVASIYKKERHLDTKSLKL